MHHFLFQYFIFISQANKKQPKKAATSSPQKESKANLSTTAVSSGSTDNHTPEQQALYDSVTAQGDKIRTLKTEKAAKVSNLRFSSKLAMLFLLTSEPTKSVLPI